MINCSEELLQCSSDRCEEIGRAVIERAQCYYDSRAFWQQVVQERLRWKTACSRSKKAILGQQKSIEKPFRVSESQVTNSTQTRNKQTNKQTNKQRQADRQTQTNQPTNQPTNQATNQLTNQPQTTTNNSIKPTLKMFCWPGRNSKLKNS